MTRNRLLLVQTGTPPAAIREEHGDLPRWFRTLLAPWQAQLTAVRVFEDEPLPAPDRQTVAVLTGSSGDGDRPSGMERTDRRLGPSGGGYRHAAVRRLLWPSADGSCLGGEVAYHSAGRESGSQTVSLSPWGVDDPLLRGLPAAFPAHLSHLQTVTRLPEGPRCWPHPPTIPTRSCATGRTRSPRSFTRNYRADCPLADPLPGGGAAGGGHRREAITR